MCLPQIIDYKMATSNSMLALVAEVQTLLGDGYEPFGSVIFSGYSFGQPMVLYHRPETPEPPLLSTKA